MKCLKVEGASLKRCVTAELLLDQTAPFSTPLSVSLLSAALMYVHMATCPVPLTSAVGYITSLPACGELQQELLDVVQLYHRKPIL